MSILEVLEVPEVQADLEVLEVPEVQVVQEVLEVQADLEAPEAREAPVRVDLHFVSILLQALCPALLSAHQ